MNFKKFRQPKGLHFGRNLVYCNTYITLIITLILTYCTKGIVIVINESIGADRCSRNNLHSAALIDWTKRDSQ